MKANRFPSYFALLLILVTGFAALPIESHAHGSITADGDLCVIQIGFYRAHFKIFQPDTSQAEEFCEDIPDFGESIFVMEYLHQGLGAVPIDFRIIKNVTGLGLFAGLDDVEAISDIEAATVFYQGPVIESEVFTVIHEFQDSGDYVGIVTARHPETDQLYTAVFPFQVGYTRFGLLPLFKPYSYSGLTSCFEVPYRPIGGLLSLSIPIYLMFALKYMFFDSAFL